MRSLLRSPKFDLNPHPILGLSRNLIPSKVHQIQLSLEWLSLEIITLLVEAKEWI